MTAEEIRTKYQAITRDLDRALELQQLYLRQLYELQQTCSHPRRYTTETTPVCAERCPDCGYYRRLE